MGAGRTPPTQPPTGLLVLLGATWHVGVDSDSVTRLFVCFSLLLVVFHLHSGEENKTSALAAPHRTTGPARRGQLSTDSFPLRACKNRWVRGFLPCEFTA